jgi:hypothetical protein
VQECLRLAAHGHQNMRTMTAAVLVRLNALTGRDEWLEPALDDFSWSPPLGWAMRALWHLALGRPDEARRYYQPDVMLADVPGIRYLVTYAWAGELAAAFGDREAAAGVHRALLPYPDLFVCGGAGLTMIDGSVRRYLGITAGALGRADEAVGYLRGAVADNEREGPARRWPPAISPGCWDGGGGPGTARRRRRWPRPQPSVPNGSACCRCSATRAAWPRRWMALEPGPLGPGPPGPGR